GGQKFLDLCLPKIRRARELMDKHGVETWLQVDGGVSLETIGRCAEAGGGVFVAGSGGCVPRRPRPECPRPRAGGRRRRRLTAAAPRHPSEPERRARDLVPGLPLGEAGLVLRPDHVEWSTTEEHLQRRLVGIDDGEQGRGRRLRVTELELRDEPRDE